jgi:hypothetical protein
MCCEFSLVFVSARKLEGDEHPHSVYIKNYSTAAPTCILLRKWLFSPQLEHSLCRDDLALKFIFWQVCDVLLFLSKMYIELQQ